MNEGFRATIDKKLLETLDELEIPYHLVRGTMPERLTQICELFDLTPVMSMDEAIELARKDYAAQDFRLETERIAA